MERRFCSRKPSPAFHGWSACSPTRASMPSRPMEQQGAAAGDRPAQSSCRRLRRHRETLDCGTDLFLARPKPTPGQGFRGPRRDPAGVRATRRHPVRHQFLIAARDPPCMKPKGDFPDSPLVQVSCFYLGGPRSRRFLGQALSGFRSRLARGSGIPLDRSDHPLTKVQRQGSSHDAPAGSPSQRKTVRPRPIQLAQQRLKQGYRQWRRGRDSNPRWACTHAAFRVRCIQPLCHLSWCLRER